jgi:magnesium chelatase accessory protein
MSRDAPEWELDGQDWPNREHSRFVDAAGLSWHVQQWGRGPALVLVHGTASATHSWRDLGPLLGAQFSVTAFDLPGHGFSSRPPAERLSLPGMAAAIAALLERLDLRPAVAVGHSAGAALLVRLALDGRLDPALLVSLNGALLPLRGVPTHVVAPVAKLLTGSALIPRLLAWRVASSGAFDSLMARTGSRLDAAGLAFYRRLASKPGHVAAALGMMSHWDLRPLERELGGLAVPLILVSGALDGMVPAFEGERVRGHLPGARHRVLGARGHLAHEECPAEVAALIVDAAREAAVLAPA